MDTAGDSEDLQLFRQKWKKELKKSREKCISDREDQGSNKCDRTENFIGNKLRCSGEEVRNLNADLGEQANFPACFHSENSCENSGGPEILEHIEDKSIISRVNQTEPVLFSLPRPGEQRSTVGDCKRQKLQPVSAKNSKKSLIDQLIEDIDEITSIPFFDLSIPKEVGIQVFSYLRLRDLCACAQVSKSWKILAEDELIWYRMGCKLGFVQEEECTLIDRTNWKVIVQHSILEERDLRRNWKERICRLSNLEFERGGSLCAISAHRNLVCSGYSSGAVVIWEEDDKDILSYKELVTTANTQGNKPQVTSTDICRDLCAAGFDNGDVYTWHTSLSSSPLCYYHCEGAVKRVFLSTTDPPTLAAVSDHELMVQMSDSNGQWTCIESKHYEDKISHAMFIPCSGGDSSTEHVALTTQDTASVLVPGKGLVFTFDHVIGGKLSCIDCTVDRLAIGVGSYGYGTLGNKVRLYCLETTKMLSILGGHYREITCLDLANCPPHHLVTGSYDCRVRVFDLRSEKIVLSFHQGQKRAVTAVQMDDWKVVSGAEDGTLMVWDRRMTSTLWMTHARHPVRFCKFEGSRMITANIPLDKTPRENLWYVDDLILHRRHRGVIRWFDFSAKNMTEGIPEICSSSYDDTSGYNYNIKLSVPYDSIEGT